MASIKLGDVSSLAIIGSILLSFQNCSEVRFSIPNGEAISSSIASLPNASIGSVNVALQEKTLTANEVVTPAPFKLLIIVDDSATMAQSKARLVANLDSLLTPLAGKDVEIRTITTSELGNGYETTAEFFKADGTSVVRSGPSFSTAAEYKDPLYVSAIVTGIVGNGGSSGRMSVSLNSKDSLAEVSAKINDIKIWISQIQMKGNSTEKVLCPILRELPYYSSSFFKGNDRAAVVVITDEDDGSMATNCNPKQQEKYSNPVLSGSLDAYNYNVQGVRVKFSYRLNSEAIYSDGLLISPASSVIKIAGSTILSSSVVSPADISLGTCKGKAETFLRTLGTKEVFRQPQNVDFSEASVANCEIVSIGTTLLVTQGSDGFGQDLCDATKQFNYGSYGVNSISQVAELRPSDQPLNSVVPNVMSLWSFNGSFAGSCIKTNSPGSIVRNNLGRDTNFVFSALGASSTSSQFDDYALTEFQKTFGDNYFMTFIVNKGDASCPLKTGQSVGQRYERLADKDPLHFRTYPICATSYELALKPVSDFVVKNTATRYKLNLPSNSKVEEVYINSNRLAPTQFRVLNDNLELSQVELAINDQIHVRFYKTDQ